jgi:hypothetical protein
MDRNTALEKARELEVAGIEPVAEYVAAAGHNHGWIKVWEVEIGFVIYYGDGGSTHAAFEENMNLDEDELASRIERQQDLEPLESIAQRANIRGADAIPAAGGDDGPFYVLMTRYWYGPRETSWFATDDRGEPMEFKTIKEAREWIAHADSGTYYLAHGEYARPSYKVVAAE